ncbi:site-specific DNA-methyltransferase [Candidatus Saccharibacteria bacterium]|nr:site-specific DNA-methyltransferase [Candidatus Saccharibacteria bacterium]
MNDSDSAKADKYADYSREQLLAEIGHLKKNKKYGLVWEHKKENVIENFETQQPYLEEVADKRIENAPDEPTNLIIEGDNFEALSILNYTHAGKVDVIYIDPPYNTGNKDFIYNDNYVDAEDEFRHSKWLSFMEPRLKLAKNILNDDGVMMISVDDHECSQLRLLCDDVFTEDNYLGTIIQNKGNAQNDAIDIQRNHEYIIVYRKKKQFDGSKIKSTISKEKTIRRPLERDDKGYFYFTGSFTTGSAPTLNERHNMGWTLYYNPATGDKIAEMDYDADLAKYENDESKVYKNNDALLSRGYIIIRAPKKKGKLGRWSWHIDTFNANKDNVVISGRNGKYSIKVKHYVADNEVEVIDGEPFLLTKVQENSRSIIDYSSSYGSTNLALIGGEFSNPKNPDMIKYLVSLMRNNNAIILDFFAGSGTTGQAVLELNKEDGGHRQFILCTNNGDKGPDSTKIAEEITYPRMKTVITGKRQDGSKYSDGIPANLRYYKINHREKKPSIDANRQDFAPYMEDILQVKENAYKQLEVAEDFALYEAKDKYVGIVFEPFALEEIIEKIKQRNADKRPVKMYVFSYSRDALEDEYDTDFEISFVAMPEGILKTYANIVAEIKKEDA